MFAAMVIGSCAVLGLIIAGFASESTSEATNTRSRSKTRRPAPRPTPRKAPASARNSAPKPTASYKPKTSYKPQPKANNVTSFKTAQANRTAKPSKLAKTGSAVAINDDLIAIIGFSNTAYPILLPTGMSKPGIRKRVSQLTSPKYFRGGATNLADGMEQALDMLEKSHGRVRRLLVISDGEPNIGVSHLPALAERARKSRVSICSIYAGSGNSPILQSMSDKTKGGWHTTARKMNDLATAIRKAGNGAVSNWRSSRRGIIVICIDMSGSMIGDLPNEPGVSRIEACRDAVQGLLDHHAATYGVKVAA
ncbi:MAG: vWA domain-containing protein [Pseudomonadota bacterium]